MKLEEGSILDNRGLVETLGSDTQKASFEKINTLQTNIRKALLKKLETIAEFDEFKVGVKRYYKIKRLRNREERLQKEIKFNRKFTFSIDKKIMATLNRFNKKEVIITGKKLIQELEVFRDAFFDVDKSPAAFIKENGIDKETMGYFLTLSKAEMLKVIEISLNRLNKEGKIKFEKKIIIVNNSGENTKASDEETNLIETIKDECLSRFNCTSIQGISFIGANSKYNRMLKKRLDENGMSYAAYFYEAYVFTDVESMEFLSYREQEIIDNHLRKSIANTIYNRCINRRIRKLSKSPVAFGEELFKDVERKESFLRDIEVLIDKTLFGIEVVQ